ncbi:2OG-Fe(II) oxygenase [Exidia glandulosa HHB12029]|uniref:2OG-Fe(II) oxygenase n=1 Tax=Exidia glandulosa HHB12029 TaxID=1314781 RepID=A0A166A8W6_EXIGL|nr:2OG-Fe(II) oxygenase [Exidia glandulosa HHB12029]
MQATAPPVIDISALVAHTATSDTEEVAAVARALHDAFSTWGFCQVVGHGVPKTDQDELVRCAGQFFDLPEEEKIKLDVRQGGVAWRGYMPRGGEGTHGRTDRKEGIYIGPEHSDVVQAGMPLHGRNQFPPAEQVPGMRDAALTYADAIIELGKTLTAGASLALGLERDRLSSLWLTPEPVALFRCFKYTPLKVGEAGNLFGIGEHTDFGYLTILKQEAPGLQVLSPSDEWVDVPVIENAFVVNVGDMFDMLTSGRFRSRPHRVLPPPVGAPARLSFPFFFDFSWTAKMYPLSLDHLPPLSDGEKELAERRWKLTTFRAVRGEWWQYLAKKVQKVFPDLKLPDFEANAAPSTRFTRPVETTVSA